METCRLIAELVAAPGRELHHCQTAAKAIELAQKDTFDLVISDINLNGPESGLDVLKAFKQAYPGGEVVLISGFGTLDTAVQAARGRSTTPVNCSTSRRSAATGQRSRATARVERPPNSSGVLEGSPDARQAAVYKQIACCRFILPC